MQITRSTVTTLFMVALITLAGIGGFAMSASAETTTLAGDGTDNPTSFNASADDHFETSVAADGTDFDTDGSQTLHMNVSYDGHDYATLETTVDDGTSASQTLNLSHDELEKLPGDAGENTTITVTTWGEDADGNVATATNSFDVDLEFAETHAVRTVHSTNDSIVSNFESASNDDDGWFGGFSISSINIFSAGSLDTTATVEDTVGVDGTQTDIQVYSEDSDMTDALDAAVENTDEGDRVGYLMTSTLDGQSFRVYDSEPGAKSPASDENVTEGEDTYAVYNGDGHMTIYTGTDRFDEDTSEIDMEINSGEEITRTLMQEDLDYGSLEAWGLNFGNVFSLDTGMDKLPF